MIRISLKAARINARVDQKTAAKALGVTTKTLRNYENGITAIPGHSLRKAARLYNFPEDLIELPNVEDGEYDDIFLTAITV